ncbi:16S rRNA (uracil(1498)-N(3))-methyltransferase [Coprococcus sp. OM04-5BH]|uniref:16S rRNA (uracil(1498)-N(3))-methyltransferase n=1 Tax=Coprococcus sp. OM04-5BH TaxID=2293093 RepID=UPI000E4E7CED|nr:16S rRNA (uracil(1498)-N(3))-methyltransferase [Coprococcus sp. OM04-5BH]RHV31910.1 16S rRNA (uracil(1498)-N(3))-methyltransferase [Coprococcus sp. OM04-5BH]
MNRFFVDDPGAFSDRSVVITGEDVNHVKNVLRLKENDELIVSDGRGRDYHCRISGITNEEVVADICDICDNFSELSTEITLFQGFPKGDKMELIIQKTVELGVTRIVPVMTKRTVVKLDDKKAKKKTERYNMIAESAAKQSGRGMIPEVTMPVSFAEAVSMAEKLDMNIIPYEEAEGVEYSRNIIKNIKGKKSLGIFIGPEGGFAREEVEKALDAGVSAITLGHRILRTETAGMAVISIIMFELEEDR